MLKRMGFPSTDNQAIPDKMSVQDGTRGEWIWMNYTGIYNQFRHNLNIVPNTWPCDHGKHSVLVSLVAPIFKGVDGVGCVSRPGYYEPCVCAT